MYNCHGEVAAYLQAEPAEALQYILDDFLLAFNLVDKTADGLALLVSAICQAAALELPGETLYLNSVFQSRQETVCFIEVLNCILKSMNFQQNRFHSQMHD